MDCRTSSEIAMKWMDGPLAEPEERAWLTHVEECDVCRQEFLDWKAVKHALEYLPPLQPREGFEKRVMAAIDPYLYKAAPAISRRHSLRHLLVLTGALGLAGLLVAETAQLMRQLAAVWLQGNPAFQALAMIYQRVELRGMLNLLLPLRGNLEWLNRFDGIAAWWAFVGILNLVMLLVLITVSLDRLLAGGRREVH